MLQSNGSISIYLSIYIYLFEKVFLFSSNHPVNWGCWITWWFCFYFFEELPGCFPYWLCHFTSPLVVSEGSLFSTTSPTFVVSCHFGNSHSDSWEMTTYSGKFWFALLRWLVMLSIFSSACWPSVCLLWKNVYSDHLPIFNLIVCLFVIDLYELFTYLNINPLSDIWFANIFSHSVGCLFVLLWSPLLCSFIVLCRPTCLYLLSLSLHLEWDLKKILLRVM